MNLITENNNQNKVYCVYQTNKFCNMPLEIIDNICLYLTLESIINLNKTCELLQYYTNDLPIFKKLKEEYKKITTHKLTNYLTIKPSFAEYSRKLFLENLDSLSESSTEKQQAITSTNASRVYGTQFALLNIMSNGLYTCKKPYEVDTTFFHETTSRFINSLDFLSTNEPNKYLLIINDYIYLFDSFTNKKETVINNEYFSQNKFLNVNYNVVIKNKFIVINSSKGNAIILKKEQNSYRNATPKTLEKNYNYNNKISTIFTDLFNNTCFIILQNNRVYIYTEKQHLINDSSSTSACYDICEITPDNLIVLEVKTSKNNNLILFYGENKTTKKVELHVQFKEKIIAKLDIIIPLNSIKHEHYQFFCSPTGLSFIATEILANRSTFLTNIILYKISSNNELTTFDIQTNFKCSNGPSTREISYITNDIVAIIDPYSTVLAFTNDATYLDDPLLSHYINNKHLHYFQSSFSNFNQAKNLCAKYYEGTISIYKILTEGVALKLKISCKQRSEYAKFSPNSQLVMSKEVFSSENQNDNIFNTVRIYRIITKDQKDNFKFLHRGKLIAEFRVHEDIKNFEFDPSGLKIIISTNTSIKIIDLIKEC